MSTALIGYTGLVGGTLARALPDAALFNSKNIDDVRGRAFDRVICAGARAEKWRINQDPGADTADLERLTSALARVAAGEVILISTVDVYPQPRGVDEDSWIDVSAAAPYGAHRLALEHFVAARFPTRILRLPGLFGAGLKKNVVFDLLHGNQVDRIHPDGSFQFYDLARLDRDIAAMRARGLSLLNVATEPITVRRIAREVFAHDLGPSPAAPAAAYDFLSKHAALWGGRDGYLYDAQTVLDDMKRFVATERLALA